VLDRLWARLWLGVFLATAIPLAAFLLFGLLLIQNSVENADIRSLGRQARTLTAVVVAQTPDQRVRMQDAVTSVGRRLLILPIEEIQEQLPDDAAATLRDTGFAEGRKRSPDDVIFGAVRVGDEVVILQRPYETPVLDWSVWLDRVLLGGLLAVACSIVVSLLLAREVARPVDRVVRASHALAHGQTPASLPEEGPRELRSLTESFNTMSHELDRARDAERRFLLSVSHELRTHVAAVRGFAEGVEEGVIDPHKGTSFILAESHRLERLIGDLLDLARLRAGRFDVRTEPLDLQRVAEAAAERCRAGAEEPVAPVVVLARERSNAVGDPDRVLQCVTNLIENALRYTPTDGVVTVETGPGLVRVLDAGPGLTSTEARQAFDMFVLHDSRKSDGRRAGGAGIGLALVREFAEAMGGSVEVAAAPGGGGAFTIRLPRSLPPESPGT
jgi:two-component system sensor histidine kinase BaeS